MITIRAGKDGTIVLTVRLFRWRFAVHIRIVDIEWWRCQTSVS